VRVGSWCFHHSKGFGLFFFLKPFSRFEKVKGTLEFGQSNQGIRDMVLLSERLRPTLARSEHLVGGAARVWKREARQWLKVSHFHLIFWGPPGCGKTTLARLLGEASGLRTVGLSAVRDGVKEIRSAANENRGGILFIDEIHRLNKAQQDVLLPMLEECEIWLMGATTESPMVSLNPAVLSRLRSVYVKPPTTEEMIPLLQEGLQSLRAENPEAKPPFESSFEERFFHPIIKTSQGDGRLALNTLESLYHCQNEEEQKEVLNNLLRSYTEKGHYDFASAMIKSLRGSDPDAALYYAIAALDAGEDPLFLFRRCMIFASEDVGNADPQALVLAVASTTAFEKVGMPEGRIPLAQIVCYLASTVKSNRSYTAIEKVRLWRKEAENFLPPLAQLRPPAPLIKAGSAEYRYPHDYPDAFVAMEYLPPAVAQVRLRSEPAYVPTQSGTEKRFLERLGALWNEFRQTQRKGR
jgi:putative ATPase